jgi:hypothetical protein
MPGLTLILIEQVPRSFQMYYQTSNEALIRDSVNEDCCDMYSSRGG